MFDVRQAGRLLQQTWEDPSALARELYDIAVVKGDRVIDNPVEMVAVVGATALKLTRVAQAAHEVATRAAPAKAAPANPASAPARRKLPTVLPPGLPSGPANQGAFARPSKTKVSRASAKAAPIRPSLEIAEAPRGKVAGTVGPTGDGEKAQVGQFRPNPPPSRPRIPTPAPFAKPYAAPLFEVPGAIKIEPNAPVQFDRPPLVFNPITSEYQPLQFSPSFTNIPRENAYA